YFHRLHYRKVLCIRGAKGRRKGVSACQGGLRQKKGDPRGKERGTADFKRRTEGFRGQSKVYGSCYGGTACNGRQGLKASGGARRGLKASSVPQAGGSSAGNRPRISGKYSGQFLYVLLETDAGRAS